MAEPTQPWKPDGVAFCWQPKAALHRIREALDAEHAVSSGLLVYLALTEIASDKRSLIFQTTHAFIGMRCGLSPRTVQQRIKDLCGVGVIRCDVPNLKAPATYTMLTVEPVTDKQSVPRVTHPLPNDANQMPSDGQPLHSDTQRSKKPPLLTSKECIQELPKNGGKNLPPISPAQQRIEWEGELKRIGPELRDLGRLSDHTRGDKRYNRIVELMARQTELRKLLGVIA